MEIRIARTGHSITLVDIDTNEWIETFSVVDRVQDHVNKYLQDNDLTPDKGSQLSFPWAGKIPAGARVRSYDFDLSGTCFVEGVVEKIGLAPTMSKWETYHIRIDKVVWNDKEKDPQKFYGEGWDGMVYPPTNGQQKLFGGVTDKVKRVWGKRGE